MALPSGYTPLEFITSSGTQYFNLGFKPNQNTRMVVDIELPAQSSYPKPLFGSRNGDTSSLDSFVFWSINANNFRTDFGTNTLNISVAPVGRFLIDKNKAATTINGVAYTNPSATFQSNYPIGLLTEIDVSGPDSRMVAATLYNAKVYDNGVLIRDLIPCQADGGEIGLWDDVNAVFYGNAGTGTFIAGPVAVQPEAPETLEVIGTTQNAVVLAWPAVPVDKSYRLYRDGVVVYEGNDLHYTDSGLAAGSSHTYSIHGLGGTSETVGVTAEATTTDGIVLITDRTASDVSAGRRKGYYNALDLIRVGEAMVYAKGLLKDSGYAVSIAVKLDWQLNDIPTKLQMDQYISSVRNLRHAMDLLATTPAAPDSMDRLGYSGANDIEKILEDVEYTVHHVFSCLWRAGQFDAWAGDRRPFAIANSDMGRTWEELDAMNTTWSNWEVASWYLLLYGNLQAEGVIN